jgi:glycosyltransferase involved in cell wall biosynthesis
MARSKCLIILSEIESFGFTPIEAAQVGTPTIWLGCQGIDETMEHGTTGFRISRKEYKFWKARRQRAAECFNSVNVLDQEEMALHVRQRFSMGQCTHRYENLYTELLNA